MDLSSILNTAAVLSTNICDMTRSQTINIHQSFISTQDYNKAGKESAGQARVEMIRS